MTKPQRETARLSDLNRALNAINVDIGAKSAVLLMKFHEQWVAPLEERIAILEAPFWRRWMIRRLLNRQRRLEAQLAAAAREAVVDQTTSDAVTAEDGQ